MATIDPRVYQMHAAAAAAAAAGVHPSMLNSMGQRYPQHATTSSPGQPGPSSSHHHQQRQGSNSGGSSQGQQQADVKQRAGPGWETTYRTAQNISFPEPKAACGEHVGEFVEEFARGIGCPVEYILVPLLPCVAGLLGTRTSIKVHRSWSEPPVIWSVVGANGGSRRSAVIRQLLAPILSLQASNTQAEAALRQQNLNGIVGNIDEDGDRIMMSKDDSSATTRSSSTNFKRALYSGTRITLAAITEVLHRNDGHAFSLTENVENLHDMLGLTHSLPQPRLISVMEDLYEGLPLVAVEEGKVTTILGSNFCHGGFASPEYMVSMMLRSQPWFSARVLLSCPQSDDMKGVFGEPNSLVDIPDLEQVYTIIFQKHQEKQTYTYTSEALQELSKFFDEEWSTVLNQLDQNDHEGIIGKSMGQIVRLSGILRAFENGIIAAKSDSLEDWNWEIDVEMVQQAIILGKYFLEQKLAMIFMVGTGFFSQAAGSFSDSGTNNETVSSATTLPQTAMIDNMNGQGESYHFKSSSPKSSIPSNSSSKSMDHENGNNTSQQSIGFHQVSPSALGLPKQTGDVDFSTLPHTMTTVEEDVSEMMQAIDFVHFTKTQFVAVHGRRIKRLLECYDDGHGVSATTAAQKSITPPVRIEGSNNRHPAWASALFFQKVAELDLGSAEQGRHPTNRKVCWRFKRKPLSQLQEKDFQLLQYLRVEMDKYSQFGSVPFNPSVMVNSGIITLPPSSSPGPHQHLPALSAVSSPHMQSTDADPNPHNHLNSPQGLISAANIKSEVY